ncbi:hypothetical protein C9374_001842 [Naegleria lovaniensis]|uniref:Uncharacterized protein n=1 Tax=Naegleria lovaniensis TaxID=51637 RepID=A0AA88GTL2_NAELO|nr:uncharacterized protein C9374_001842 [Naegleria lovaniensis]KAG2386807.1 hypothetical protein C9374_001842 [Naegleria lovaniensis]
MVNTEQLNQNLGNNICFIPILSGIMYEELAFKAPEYGNQEFFLPPLSPSNLHDILKDVFRGKMFLCKTSMLDMLEIETTEIVRSMGIMLLEALVIPEVLTLTLNKIISFMKSITFDTWKQSSSTLFPNLKEQVDEEVSQYLRQETKFTNHTFQKSLVARLLCGLSLPLTNEEQDLFKLGKIYLTENGRLYIAPHYFQLVIRADSYIAVKLPKTKLEIDPRYFERIDLKCLCYRIFMLQQRGNFLITIEQLFPSCVTGVDKDYLFTLPATTEMFKVVDLTETFITKGSDVAQYDIDCSKCRKQFSEVYSYTLSTHPCVNAHFWLQTSLHNRTSLFLIQHRNYDSCLNVVDWLNTNNFADNAFEKFGKQEIDVYFVMISTSTISQEQLEKLKNHKHFQRTILISHHSSREEYFPTHLLPYYKAFVFYKDQHDNQELEHQQDPRAVL